MDAWQLSLHLLYSEHLTPVNPRDHIHLRTANSLIF